MALDLNWSAPQHLSFAGSGVQHVAIAAMDGVVHLVWTRDRTIFHASLAGGEWSPAARVATGDRPALAASDAGSLVCAYTNVFLGNREVYVVTWDGARWSLPQPVSHTTGGSYDPSVCLGSDGIIHLAWADTTPGESWIYYAARRNGAWTNAPVPNGRGSRPSIAANGGEVNVAWQDRSPATGRYDVLAAARHDGEWTLPNLISDAPEVHSLFPRIASSTRGHCHLIWQEERDQVYVIRHADHWPLGWTAPVDVSDPAVDARLAHALPNRYGLFQFIWLEGALLKHRVRPGEPNAAWWEPELACDECGDVTDLAATLSPGDGQLHVVFGRFAANGARELFYTRRKAIERKKTFLPQISN